MVLNNISSIQKIIENSVLIKRSILTKRAKFYKKKLLENIINGNIQRFIKPSFPRV